MSTESNSAASTTPGKQRAFLHPPAQKLQLQKLSAPPGPETPDPETLCTPSPETPAPKLSAPPGPETPALETLPWMHALEHRGPFKNAYYRRPSRQRTGVPLNEWRWPRQWDSCPVNTGNRCKHRSAAAGSHKQPQVLPHARVYRLPGLSRGPGHSHATRSS